MRKLAIIGYGQMGKLVDELAGDYGFEIVSRIDPQKGTEVCAGDMNGAEIAIEFTEPGAAVNNIRKCLELGIKVVCGTTGWNDKLEEIIKEVTKHKGALVYGSNFSPGMNLFYKIVESAAEIMNHSEDYDVYGYELHHRHKKDSPSGTAKQLAQILLSKLKNKEQVVYECLERKRTDKEIHFASVRGGEIPGEHIIGFDSAFDSIELKHVARNRKGLAAGALQAAWFLLSRQGCYNFRDILGEL
ncbi:MAG: 4-hydroxy-tetrahydrodipicolinate reductase [Candidatus Cloacimonetes bacterium]|nr:4-hydroxy-tetrahydrodipicolinate reductase [Candidatus Cloacimonadota bacterium]